MRIGIDCRSLSGGGGIAHYTKNLVKNLLINDKKNTYVLFFDTGSGKNFKRLIKELDFDSAMVKFRKIPEPRYKRLFPVLYSHFIIGSFLNKSHIDLLHSPAIYAPLGYRGRLVVTAHDFAIYRHPEWFPGGQYFSKKVVVPRVLKKADMIISVSQTTKDDAINIFHIPKEKIRVVYEAGYSPRYSQKIKINVKDYFEQKIGSSEYILFVGTLEPRKNLKNLISAFSAYRQKYPMAREKLVLAGGKGWKYKGIFDSASKSKFKKDIIFTGYISEQEKILLMKSAKIFAFPSLYEGFGLPVLEAMSLGVPVITSSRGSLGEITGSAAVRIDPNNIDSIAKALGNMLSNKKIRKKFSNKGYKKALGFSWEKCALETIKVYKEIVYS